MTQKDKPETKTQHVVPYEGKWGVRAANSQQPSKTFTSKTMAIVYAYDITKKQEGGKVVVHKKDGTIKSVKITEETSKLMSILRS